MHLNHLKLGPRLALGFGAVLALLALIVGIAYWQLSHTCAGLNVMNEQQQRAGLARDWVGRTQLNVARTIAIAKASGQPQVEGYFAPLIKHTTEEISVIQKTLEQAVADDEGKAQMATIAEKRKVYIATRDQLATLIKQSDAPAADALITQKLLPACESYLASMRAFESRQIGQAHASLEQLQE